jgi:hypothetical protein
LKTCPTRLVEDKVNFTDPLRKEKSQEGASKQKKKKSKTECRATKSLAPAHQQTREVSITTMSKMILPSQTTPNKVHLRTIITEQP